MDPRNEKSPAPQLAEVCSALQRIAPLGLAESWDNVGLLAGDPEAPVRCVLACIDLTRDVVTEAVDVGAHLVLAYHPPLFKPVSRLNAAGKGTDAHVFSCIANGIAIYSPHTALDSAEGGTNDVLAELCGVADSAPIQFVDEPGRSDCKVVVFVPADEADVVAEGMFAAGAGRIGEYSKCSFRLAGQGTFLGSEDATPTIGEAGRFERVDEIRLEAVVPSTNVPDVVRAIRATHSYEEPAFDVYPLRPPPVPGMGRCGMLPEPIQLAALAAKLRGAVGAKCVQIVGDAEATVRRVICMVGAAGSYVLKAGLQDGDVVVTGEIRHHDALAIQRHGACAVALNHWTSERPALRALADRLMQAVPSLEVRLSQADREPFVPV